MIYIYAIFFGCGAMHLMKFLWANYSALVLGENVMTLIESHEAMQAGWAGSYIIFSLLIVLAASVPAARNRDFTLAAINAAIIGTIVGISFAGLVYLRGDAPAIVDLARIAFVPVGLSLLVGMAGFGGALLYEIDGNEVSGNAEARGAANDNKNEAQTKLAA